MSGLGDTLSWPFELVTDVPCSTQGHGDMFTFQGFPGTHYDQPEGRLNCGVSQVPTA